MSNEMDTGIGVSNDKLRPSIKREIEYQNDISEATDSEWELAWALQNVVCSGNATERSTLHQDSTTTMPLYLRQARSILGNRRNLEAFTDILLSVEDGGL